MAVRLLKSKFMFVIREMRVEEHITIPNRAHKNARQQMLTGNATSIEAR